MGSVQLTLGQPVVISQAPPAIRDWGPWQFPLLERVADGRLHARFHISPDSAASYGNPMGHALSSDEGQSWEETRRNDFPDGILCTNGDRVRIKVKPPFKQEEMIPSLPPISSVILYGREIRVYSPEAFPPEMDKWFLERMKSGTNEWVEEEIPVNLPGITNWAADGVVPRHAFWRLRKAPDGTIWGITYTYLDYNDLTRRTDNAIFCVSTDNGHSFELISHIEYQPIPSVDKKWEKRGGYHEPDITFAPDGSIFCLLRTTDGHGIGPLHFCRSIDNGKTWTKPAYFDDRGVWPTLLTLENGITLAGYGRTGLFLRATADPSCLKWEDRIAIIPPGEYQTETCSYCDMVALGEDSAYIIYSDFNYPNPEGIPVKTILGRKITAKLA